MIKQLIAVNFVKHKNKSFNFEKGLNTITGANEVGKSLLLEAINFALHGASALRLPASTYDSKTEVALTVEIRGKEYKIKRTLRSASLYCNGEEIAKSTSVVNKQLNKLLGYGFDVYQVANMASQGEIRYLSALKPAERKRMIDKTLGLTATKRVIENHNNILKGLNSSIKTLESVKPNEPKITEGFSVELEEDYLTEIKLMQSNLADLVKKNHVLVERKNQLEKLKLAVDNIVIPELSEPVPEGVTLELISNLEFSHQDLKSIVSDLGLRLTKLNSEKSSEHKTLDKTRTQLEALTEKLSGLTLDKLSNNLEHHQLAETKRMLLRKGGLTCKKCGELNHFGEEDLSKLPEWVDENFTFKTDVTIRDFDKLDELKELLAETESKLKTLDSEIENCEQDKEKADGELSKFESETGLILESKEQFKKSLRDTPKRERAITELNLLNSQIEQLGVIDYDTLHSINIEISSLNNKIDFLNTVLGQISKFKDYQEEMKSFQRRIEETKVKVELEQKILETLNILLNSIRNNMLPKINTVASTWLRKLSLGMHSEVILDDNMEILVDGLSIDAYSGSGKSIAHIALRLSLAQILTRGVFPVFLADEVDADMDKERSEATLNAFKEMLQISTEQIILISHQDLNLKLDSDNAIQL